MPGHRIVAVSILLLVAGCASAPLDDASIAGRLPQKVGSFSAHPPGDALPPGWAPWVLSGFKRPTEYRLVQKDGITVMRADARSSASGLIHPLSIDARQQPLIEWRWKIERPIARADNTQRHLEDSPVRLLVSFDGNIESLPAQDRLFISSVHLLTGQQLPYATLMYIWENRAPRGTVIANQHTSRIKMIVAESGVGNLGAWQHIRRNVYEDYRRAFGEEPGRITAVGIMTDTDNTGEQAQAWYGDIHFKQANDGTIPTASR